MVHSHMESLVFERQRILMRRLKVVINGGSNHGRLIDL